MIIKKRKKELIKFIKNIFIQKLPSKIEKESIRFKYTEINEATKIPKRLIIKINRSFFTITVFEYNINEECFLNGDYDNKKNNLNINEKQSKEETEKESKKAEKRFKKLRKIIEKNPDEDIIIDFRKEIIERFNLNGETEKEINDTMTLELYFIFFIILKRKKAKEKAKYQKLLSELKRLKDC